MIVSRQYQLAVQICNVRCAMCDFAMCDFAILLLAHKALYYRASQITSHKSQFAIRNSQFAIFSPEYPADTVIQLPLVSRERCQAGKGQQGVRGETT